MNQKKAKKGPWVRDSEAILVRDRVEDLWCCASCTCGWKTPEEALPFGRILKVQAARPKAHKQRRCHE